MPFTGSCPHDGLPALLTCPVCRARLVPAGRALRCAEGRHSFDVARQGYLSLMTGRRARSADTPEMVRARTAFLGAGHYAPLASRLAGLALSLCPADGTVLDAGVGTGYYLAAVLDALPGALGLGLDTSAYALRAAARAHPRAGAASWDVWRPLPVRTGSVDLVLNVFAPRNGGEFHRVLRPDGALLVLTPASGHLRELRSRLGLLSVDPAKERRLHSALGDRFRHERTEPLEYVLRLGGQDLDALVSMGPTAHHIDADELRHRIARLSCPQPVTVSVRASVYRPR
ncbi:methyltransferase domain-containing protein [Streptomyces luomodiensis]|uniref:Methyltransferase domain-containing protein n=1 Tax=Streptomyces luomodiensis TaxID=3026192 RepID=A0ABY9UW89_9ACTN|nr:methyltransferase domain-containing protein [Streptomyces sp. SCA4-21]WNE96149.1 methyltransferase domain-containing protein [Streptomyces sp. SCA4-21]